ncbi:hypothetical protein QVD17_14130 [Tagetes erecta]|uniref:B box-type domain-containing protein n=1 Tax=Tagetes erecta TaxID=13708 RepID=A0AAD8L1E3_TARER|nr:hypothetical protein QVD17_14130 [Tagetes erecta]
MLRKEENRGHDAYKRSRTSKLPKKHFHNRSPENQKSSPENHNSATGMKRCELCSHFARIYCQSDNASLCYDCDQNVHSSNFLVAKHSRTLLCHKCQSPTPWTASGLNLGRAATVCVTCLDEDSSQRRLIPRGENENDVVAENRHEHENENTDDEVTESSEDEYEDDEDEDEEDEDAENQVVPWSSVASPVVTAASSSEELSSSRSTTNRERLDAYIDSEDDTVCSSRSNSKRITEISLKSFRPLKMIRSETN